MSSCVIDCPRCKTTLVVVICACQDVGCIHEISTAFRAYFNHVCKRGEQ